MSNELDNINPEIEGDIYSDLDDNILATIPPVKIRVAMLWVSGQTNFKEIGKVVGYSSATISKWLRSPELLDLVRNIQKSEFDLIDASIKSLRYKAVETLKDLLDSEKDEVRLSASKDILDRSGHRPTQQVKIDKHVSIEQQLKDLADVTIDDAEVIEITELEEEQGNVRHLK